ncbi:MAG: excinuclease ABC subunit UvrC [Clostridia bacterium]|nr:excinuclease ABC subunit UvrC [Clostridia bacterium]MDH7572896.1 excinuclease ABC subunit UvrC [Clostridia bacterium]
MGWQDKVKDLPEAPGVYLMRDASGEVIYVGKASSLRQRVRSYVHDPAGQPPKVRALVQHVADLEYIVTDTPVEALVLECNLIKSYRPRYNVNLKDDKAYPYLKITLREEFPRLAVTRRRQEDGSRYFGPYTNAGALRQTLRVMRRVFPLRTCKTQRWPAGQRPCLDAHLGLCLAPCAGRVDSAAYRRVAADLVAFLEGRGEILLRDLRRRMEEAARELRFEEAARLRDRWQALEEVLAHRRVAFGGEGDRDVVGLAVAGGEASVQVFTLRGGAVTGRENFFLEAGESEAGEILRSFLQHYYSRREEVPAEILLPGEPEDRLLLEQWLTSRRGRRVRLLVPRRGTKREQVARAEANAAAALDLRQKGEERRLSRVAAVGQALGLAALARRIEGYDISHLGGTAAVGSMVVFVDGRPEKASYRRFRVREAERGDDYGALREVLRRRLERLAAGDPGFAAPPDLILVDGGRGQVEAAREVLEEAGWPELPVYGLAKAEEVLYYPGGGPLELGRDSPALQLLQEVRDEAHRFAQSYHHRLRQRETRRSVLGEVPGVGPKRRRALLEAFGSVEGLRRASVEEIAAVKGMSRALAARVKAHLEAEPGEDSGS